jgi:manganese transport protein
MTLLDVRRAVGAPRLGATRRMRGSLAFLGPAFVAGIAYVDPGNVATNTEAGARFGYQLLWVVVAANLIAAFMQALAAKLGLATGRNLAEVSRDRFPRPVTLALWAQAEVVAIATDLAEVVGGAIALQILFGLSLPVGAIVTAVAAYGVLALHNRGSRRLEIAVAALFAVIAGGFCLDAVWAHPSAGEAAAGLVPGLAGPGSALLATAIVGATVMPHALYVHSAMTQRRTPSRSELSTRRALRLQRIDIGVAMGTAGLVNISMIVLAAAVLPTSSGGIPELHGALITEVGALAGFLFVVALLASGLASSSVGTYAGEVVMSGYLRRRIPRAARRLVTVVPSVVLLFFGVPATEALVASQFVLGIGVPFALGALIIVTRNRAVMGDFVNRRITTILASVCAGSVIAIDVYSMTTIG